MVEKMQFFPLQLRIVMGTNPDSISIRLGLQTIFGRFDSTRLKSGKK